MNSTRKSVYSLNSTKSPPRKPGVIFRRRGTTKNNNSNNNYNNVVSINLNTIKPNWRPEVPKGNEKFRTPNRPTKNPFGKLGFRPNEPPPRRQTRKHRQK